MTGSLHWLITSTTYGTWLPGAPRGFVGRVWDARPDDPAVDARRLEHDEHGTEYDRDLPGLYAASKSRLKGEPILLSAEQADAVLSQFHETAGYRKWDLRAVSAMANHFHVVVTAPADVKSEHLLRDFKSYSSGALSRRWGKPASGTWWTESGSRRRLPDDDAVARAVRYVWDQHGWLARWVSETDAGGLILSPERGV